MRRRSPRRALWVLFILCGGCASDIAPPFPYAEAEPRPAEYRIQPGDQLGIHFTFNERLNQEVLVRSDGRISLPLVEEVDAAGLTPRALEMRLTELYAAEIERPEISVMVRVSAQRVFIFGEVRKPGEIRWVPELTALQAAAQVGGFTDRARLEGVVLIREDQSFQIDLKEALSDPTTDVVLEPYDSLYVPLSGIASVNLWVDQYIRRNIPISFRVGPEPF
ncbi:MAG: polysaccharide export protein [Deltaproteobacteria bacterium]|nr:MAG: polysaccharide export protein [Deltaproteobacteria bacterium]